jgi:hypothetical protein
MIHSFLHFANFEASAQNGSVKTERLVLIVIQNNYIFQVWDLKLLKPMHPSDQPLMILSLLYYKSIIHIQ